MNRHLVLGGPGAGKTEYLIGRVEDALESGIPPEAVAFVSFTQKAANEAKERACKKFNLSENDLPYFRTIHSMCYRNLGLNTSDVISYQDKRAFADWINEPMTMKSPVDDEWDGYGAGITDGDRMLFLIGYADAKCIPLQEAWSQIQVGRDIDWHRMERFHRGWLQWKAKNKKLDFSDMLAIYCKQNQPLDGIQFAVIDEAQDLSAAQWNVVDLAFANTETIYCAGDDDQCQPAGTMVTTTDGEKDIADLDPKKDMLLTYSRSDAAFYGGQWSGGYKFKKETRRYFGDMYEIVSSAGRTRCTATHKWLVKWTKAAKGHSANCVYLMQKGPHFRVGWCQLFSAKELFHLQARVNVERADRAWILKIVGNKKDAHKWESYYASEYGIPQMPFHPACGAYTITQEVIDFVFSNVDTNPRGRKLLADLGLEYDFPFTSSRGDKKFQRRTRVFETVACNLLDGMMLVPTYKEKQYKKSNWSPIRVKNLGKTKKGVVVYSMNVDKYHMYVADGMATCNSIHSWAGASMSRFMSLAAYERHVLPKSYRLKRKVFDYAAGLVSGIQNRYQKEWGPRAEGGAVVRGIDPDQVPIGQDGSWYLLARNNIFCKELEGMCFRAGINFSNKFGPAVRADDVQAIAGWEDLNAGKTVTIDMARTVLSALRMRRVLHEKRPYAIAEVLGDRMDLAGKQWDYVLYGIPERRRAYYMSILRGGGSLLDKPTIHVGTIHSVKGGEADHVLMLSDCTRLTAENANQDDELRVSYVGVTRARETVWISQPTGLWSMPF